jgi:MinD superfamily P-loop ATPase
MIISIASGKGGTGKTVVSACFAVLASNKVMADCDVDAVTQSLKQGKPLVEFVENPTTRAIKATWENLKHQV